MINAALFERDMKLLKDMRLWIETVRQWREKKNEKWLPSDIDMLKSRLFWRIRSGKDPLPHPPPTAYSCPWYELIEENDRGHWAWEVGVYEELFGKKQEPPLVAIAQCLYTMIERSDKRMRVRFGPWEFDLWFEPKMCPSFMDGKIDTVSVPGWWIQRVGP